MARKQIDFSKLTLKQLLFYTAGLAMSITGLVLSIILFVGNLYTDREVFPVNLTSSAPQVLCTNCQIGPEESLWLRVGNRQIESTDIDIQIALTDQGGSMAGQSSSTFRVVNMRTQLGGTVYYRLQDLAEVAGQTVTATLIKAGNDILSEPADVVIRTFNETKFNLFYIALFIVGNLLLVMGWRSPGRGQS